MDWVGGDEYEVRVKTRERGRLQGEKWMREEDRSVVRGKKGEFGK